jgi:hypothetical protein
MRGYGYISPWFLQEKYWRAAQCNPQHHTGEYMTIYLEDREGNPTELGKDNFLISGVHCMSFMLSLEIGQLW